MLIYCFAFTSINVIIIYLVDGGPPLGGLQSIGPDHQRGGEGSAVAERAATLARVVLDHWGRGEGYDGGGGD